MKGQWRRVTSWLAVATAMLMAAPTNAAASSDATVVRTTMGSTVGFHSAYATCPNGEDATGGGVALSRGSGADSYQLVSDTGPVDITGTFLHTTTGRVPVGWYGTSDIITSGSTAYVWAVCSSTVTTVVRRTIAGGATTGFHSGSARCPAGRRATGGGLGIKVGSSPTNYQFISDNAPLSSSGKFVSTTTGTVPIQWYGTADVVTSGTTSYVWAVCSRLATTVVRKTISSGAVTGFHVGYARCPTGQRATGGGLALSGGSSAGDYQFISDTGPVSSSATFDGTPTGTIPIDWYVAGDVQRTDTDAYGWAVCG